MAQKEIGQWIARVFAELGATDAADITDTLFIDGGKCLAVAFHTEGFSAVWCCEEETVEFHDRDGRPVRSLQLPGDLTGGWPASAL
jgi:hypothetical protein